jgi:muramoyltetrapeptide carboxypeptidase
MRVGVVSPSGSFVEPSLIERGIATLANLGLEVELAPHATSSYGHLAGTDQERAGDLLTMLERPDIDAVLCLKGGAGAMRTALALDHGRLAALAQLPPKAFVGFSDITVLHALLERSLGWVTFYGPMLTSLARPSPYVLEGWRRALMSEAPFAIDPDPDDPYVGTLVSGSVEGPLAGGCLTLLSQLVGTPWAPDLGGSILFFEDVDEEPYAVERDLAHLLASGQLAECRGIVIGQHTNCNPRSPGPSLALEQVFADLIGPLRIPSIYNLPIGHGRHIATLPLGARARLDADRKVLLVLESGVTST